MLSTCPTCLAQVTHADHLFDVTCDCGAHFSPFLNVDNHESTDNSQFTESSNAFQEIVNFGEGLESASLDTPVESAIISSPEIPEPTKETRIKEPPAPRTEGNLILVAGSTLSDYQIVEYFAPLSTLADLDTTNHNPMQNAFDTLTGLAQGLGATAIIGLQMTVTNDGAKVLLMGTPVRCVKIN